MTPAQLQAARVLIPGAYELNAPPHRATQVARVAPAIPFQEAAVRLPTVNAAHVVTASARATTRIGFAAAILGDVALCLALIYGVALVPALAVQGVTAAAAFVLDAFGWR